MGCSIERRRAAKDLRVTDEEAGLYSRHHAGAYPGRYHEILHGRPGRLGVTGDSGAPGMGRHRTRPRKLFALLTAFVGMEIDVDAVERPSRSWRRPRDTRIISAGTIRRNLPRGGPKMIGQKRHFFRQSGSEYGHFPRGHPGNVFSTVFQRNGRVYRLRPGT
jgi:hypothetical protein